MIFLNKIEIIFHHIAAIPLLSILVFANFMLPAQTLEVLYRGFDDKEKQLTQFETDIITNIINLYNIKEQKKIELKFIKTDKFFEIFELIDDPNKQNNICAIRSISITNKRQLNYEFSPPYMPNRKVLITNNKHLTYNDGLVVGFDMEHILDNSTIPNIILNFPLKLKEFDYRYELETALKSKNIDGYIGDLTETIHPDLYMVKILDNKIDYFGIMFPKHSNIYYRLLPYMKYYLKSLKFYSIIKDKFGEDTATFFRR